MLKFNYLKKSILFILMAFTGASLFAQLVSMKPLFPTENDSVVVTYDASLGNRALKGYTGDIYAHTGVVTQLSTPDAYWKHAPTWGDNSAKYKLNKVGTDLYEFVITPSIRTFYGATANEVIKKLAFVFRSGDKTKEGKTDTNGDIFCDVFSDGIYVTFQKPFTRPYFASLNESFEISATANKADSMLIFVNNSMVSKQASNALSYTLTANAFGKYWVKVSAYKDNVMASDSFYYFVKKQTEQAELPVGITSGLNYLSDTSLILSFTVPNKQSAMVIGDFNNWEPDTLYQMTQTPDGKRFWIKLTNLKPGTEYAYQFLVDGLSIADPYSQKVLDPWRDGEITGATYPNLKAYPVGKTNGIVSVLETGKPSYNWKYSSFTKPEKQQLVVYELLVRDFTAAHSFQAVIDSIGYLKHLGINALQLMPVMEFEGNSSWGYNPSFYFASDKYYGTSEKLKQLIDTCHALGIVVIFDMVLNHSFGQSPMVQLYWDGANSRPSAENPWYNPVAKHDYNVGFDFNHESEYTKLFVSEVVKFWLNEYKADGFRFDLSKGFTQKNTLGNVAAWGAYDANRIATWKNIADTIWKNNDKAYVILEHFADNTEEKELVNYGMMVWGNANNAYLEGAMGWNEAGKSDFSWGSYKARGMSNPGLITYMESHDEERMAFKTFKYGNNTNPDYLIANNVDNTMQRSELAAALFFTIPGAKMVWQFGELGYDYSIDFNTRVGEKPVKWDYYSVPSRNHLMEVYSSLISLKKHAAFNSPDYTISVAGAIKYVSINHSEMDVRIAGNFSPISAEANISFSKTGWWYNYFSGDSIEITSLEQKIQLSVSGFVIYTSKRLQKPSVEATVDNSPYHSGNASFIAFPNPCSDMLKIQSTDNTLVSAVKIQDILGRLQFECNVSESGLVAINTMSLKNGLYTLSVKKGTNWEVCKLMINK